MFEKDNKNLKIVNKITVFEINFCTSSSYLGYFMNICINNYERNSEHFFDLLNQNCKQIREGKYNFPFFNSIMNFQGCFKDTGPKYFHLKQMCIRSSV